MKILTRFVLFFACFLPLALFAQKPSLAFTVSMNDPATQQFHVTLQYTSKTNGDLDFKMPVWTPGYYQIMDYAKAVSNFTATDVAGNAVQWSKTGGSTWQVHASAGKTVVLSYNVLAKKKFVAESYLDETRAYIIPSALFLYLDNELRHPVSVQVKPYSKWSNLVATGLDSIPGKNNTFLADDFDVLYDSPLLLGELEVLPTFTVRGVPHYFIGYKMGNFDRRQFMGDLKKIVESAVNIIGDIPYTHYTFLAYGPGQGGIEHLNSSSLSFSGGEGFDSPEARKRLYSFIAHEYFHHYNVKRIRPIELGPFDYSKENHTNMLWVSEGFTVYYEYIVDRRAGLTNDEDVFGEFTENLKNYENKPGHLFQSAAQSSYDTWSDGPFGRQGDEAYKTISYYDKGPLLGLMLDFNIRHVTNNKKSLDDVMRTLYNKYYKGLKRGWTDDEFKKECEKIAGVGLQEVFDYAYTVKPPDYPKYFAMAGLSIDTILQALPGGYAGINARERNGVLVVSQVDWNSPAWIAGVRSKDTITEIDGNKATQQLLNYLKKKSAGTSVHLAVTKNAGNKPVDFILGTKYEKPFTITRMVNVDALQEKIFASWISGK